MSRIATTVSANQRRIAAQAIAATEARLSIAAPAQLDAASSVPSARELATVSMPMTALTPEILAAAIAQVLGGQLAAPVAPIAPVVAVPAAKLTAQQKWDAYGADKVVAKVLANGVPVNVHGMFLKRAEAIDPKGLIAAYAAAKKGAKVVAKNATPVQPLASVPSAAGAATGTGLTLAQLEQFLKALGLNLPTSAIAPVATAAAVPAAPVAVGVRGQLRVDGSWLRCPQCDDAYWAASRDDAFLAAKVGKHLAKAHAS